MASFPVFQVTEGQWTYEKLIDVLGLKTPAFLTTNPQLLCDFITNFQTGRYVLQVAGCRLQVEKWTFKSE